MHFINSITFSALLLLSSVTAQAHSRPSYSHGQNEVSHSNSNFNSYENSHSQTYTHSHTESIQSYPHTMTGQDHLITRTYPIYQPTGRSNQNQNPPRGDRPVHPHPHPVVELNDDNKPSRVEARRYKATSGRILRRPTNKRP